MPATRPPVIDFGIAGTGVALGTVSDVRDEAARLNVAPDSIAHLGYRSLRRADDEVSATELGATAARLACKDAGFPIEDVQHLIVAAGATVPEYLNWDPSTDLARALGLITVPTTLLTQGCASGVLGFQQAAGLMAIRPALDTVLFVATDRVSERHVRRIGATADSDGAAALLLRRDHRRFRWLATEQVTDAKFTDFFRLEFCGRAAACSPDPDRNLRIPPALRVFEYFRDDAESFAQWTVDVDLRVVDAIKAACKQAGVDQAEISRILLLNDSQPSISAIADAAGITEERTNARLAAELGHFGGADPLISLSMLSASGEIKDGDLIALAGMSSGMHWFCTLVRA